MVTRITKNSLMEGGAILLLIVILAYFIYTDFTKERKKTACEINSKSEDCYIETKNNEYDYDYQPGSYGPE